jgi:hypothetical protein
MADKTVDWMARQGVPARQNSGGCSLCQEVL